MRPQSIRFFREKNFRKANLKKYKTVSKGGSGAGGSSPILLAVSLLLGQADAVFGAIVVHWLEKILNVWTILIMIVMTAFGTFGVYCLICGACMDQISGEKMNESYLSRLLLSPV